MSLAVTSPVFMRQINKKHTNTIHRTWKVRCLCCHYTCHHEENDMMMKHNTHTTQLIGFEQEMLPMSSAYVPFVSRTYRI